MTDTKETRDDLFAHIGFCMKAKRQMIDNNSTVASKRCEMCEGRWHFILAGPKKHLHGACDGPCKRAIME